MDADERIERIHPPFRRKFSKIGSSESLVNNLVDTCGARKEQNWKIRYLDEI